MRGAMVIALGLDKLKPRLNDDYTVRKGGNGFGINLKEVAYTVDTTIVHGVAICDLTSGQCKHDLRTHKGAP